VSTLLVVLFAMSDGSVATMRSSQSFASPLSCSMRAFRESETARERIYVCTTSERVEMLLVAGKVEAAAAEALPARP
jgi:hypothetical protein